MIRGVILCQKGYNKPARKKVTSDLAPLHTVKMH